MFKMSEIKELIKLVDSTSIQELEIENENSKLSIRKPQPQMLQASAPLAPQAQPAAYYAAPPVQAAPAPAPAVQSAPLAPAAVPQAGGEDASNLHRIVSPMVGTFYAASAPDADSYVKVGDKVSEKTIVCIVEAMKLMNEIEAEVSGQIVEILAENGQLVEYGQPLFLVKR